VGGTCRRFLGVAFCLTALGATGCEVPPPEAQARLEAVKQQGQQLEAATDRLEVRLLGNQERLSLWRELRERHQHVSAVVVRNHSSHMEDMARLLAAQQEKSHRLNRRFAAASPSLLNAAPARLPGLSPR